MKRSSPPQKCCDEAPDTKHKQIERDARGSNETMCKVSHSHIKEWDITLPPLADQSAIIARLDDLDRHHTSASDSIKSQIQALQILRSTLIAHAITGKIKIY